MMKINKRWFVIGLFIVIALGTLTLAGAANNPLNYSQDSSWSFVTKNPQKSFDVFFIHPTTYGTTEFGLNAPIDNKDIIKETDDTVLSQASVFKEKCNIYAPRYRQMSIAALSMADEKRAPYLAVAENDVLAAFKYYLKHYNNGRPYILAAHSQGSKIALCLLKKHRQLFSNDQLVAAYLPGWTFTDEDLKQINIPLAVKPDQVGALITWNTIGKGGKSPTLLPGANCVNPLSWTNTTKEQPASLNLGAVIELTDGTIAQIQHFTSARINQAGGLEIPPPAIEDKLDMRMGKAIYHRYDYAFFHGNLVENVGVRCSAWTNKK
jgi:pimeloyl-ACP methyl ester carboxylesterase